MKIKKKKKNRSRQTRGARTPPSVVYVRTFLIRPYAFITAVENDKRVPRGWTKMSFLMVGGRAHGRSAMKNKQCSGM